MLGNGGSNFSDVVLAAAADSLAVMVERFVPRSNACFYSAKYIGEYLQGLQFGNSSTLYAEIDSLKLGLMNRSFRIALSHAFPGRFEFDKSQASDSTISKGDKKFKYGFMIKFMSSSPILLTSKNKLISNVKTLSATLLLHAKKLLDADPPLALRLNSPAKASVSPLNTPSNDTKSSARELIDERSKTKLKKLRSSLSYFKKKDNDKAILSNVTTLEKSIGEKLIDLITEANVLTEVINGKPTLSIVTGLLVQDLVSNCGCSMNKLPMIISTVITMFFGLVNTDVFRSILRAPDTYALASERAAELVVLNGRRRFTNRGDPDAILNAFLILDASNKKNKGLVAKPINYVSMDGVVKLGALKLDNTGKH
jgi:nucleoside diphosphate kinase